MRKQHWSDLTLKQKATYGNGCGCGFWAKMVPQLYFKSDCRQHDFYYRRGGDLGDKMEADTLFYGHMLKSINDEIEHFLFKIPLLTIATLYFIAVSSFGILAFGWGKYKRIKKSDFEKPKTLIVKKRRKK